MKLLILPKNTKLLFNQPNSLKLFVKHRQSIRLYGKTLTTSK